MENTVNWFEIYTSDFIRAKKFYTEVFNLKLTDVPTTNSKHSNMQYAVFSNIYNKDETIGALVKIDEAKPGIGGTLVYFSTEDILASLKKVEVAGGKIIRPKLQVGN